MAPRTVKDLAVPILIFCISPLFLSSFFEGKSASATIAFPLLQIEHKIQPTKALDQKSGSLTIQTIVAAGGGGTCEQCQFIVYKPLGSAPSKPGIAYTSSRPLDLEGAKRLVFFAKGELGGETIKPMVLGKPSSSVSLVPFKNLKFGVTSEDIVLTNDWKRYELNIEGLDSNGVTTPFALVISNQRGNIRDTLPDLDSDKPPMNNPDPKAISFYLKGVSLDNTAAVNPINK